jgi:hypothetical protein
MSVLSHLTLRFSTHPENLATEALAYILGQSPGSRAALCRFVEELSGCKLDLLRFETQAINEDRSRPDLVGLSRGGERSLAIEVKFWAGLTAAQPTGYLSALPTPGVLLFVAPAARLPTLWDELLRRVQSAGLPVAEQRVVESDGLACSIDDRVMAATSWRMLLGSLQNEAEAAADAAVAADIRQLFTLCEHMDTDAFLQLTSEEMTSDLGRRVLQFCALVNDLTAQLVQQGLADLTGLRATGGNGYFGRNLRLRGHGAYLHFSAEKWMKWGVSPIWITISGPEWKPLASIPELLRSLGYALHEDGGCHLAIPLLIGVERDAVVDNAFDQLVKIAGSLPEAAPGAAPDFPGEPVAMIAEAEPVDG